MNEQLEKLIDLALADGILTEKEKQVLNKKARELNVDLDEFEMILNAKLYLAQKTVSPPLPPSHEPEKPKSNKEGDIKKCPACGAMVKSFATVCSDCGHEYRSMQATASIQALFNHLSDIDAELRKQHSTKSFWQQGNIDLEISASQAGAISSYPVPNSKEDIVEFLTLASSQYNSIRVDFFSKSLNGPEQRMKSAWKSKCEQIIMKARFSMKEDKATLAEIEYYAKQLRIK